MSTIITNKSKNPFYVEDNVPSETTPPPYLITNTLYADAAANIIVYIASATAPVVPIDVTIIGSGAKAGLRSVSLGVNQNFTSATNSITLTNLNVATVYGGLIVSTNPKTMAICSKYLCSTAGVMTTAILTGDTSVTLNNGVFGTVFGGGAGYGAKVVGNTAVNYKGGVVTAIYGGGDTGSVVNGNTFVTIGGTATGSRINSIYGGGRNSTVVGNTTVTFTSSAALINFRGVVSGGGLGNNSMVTGSRNLIFDNYSGMFYGAIRNFTNITCSGSTTMVLAQNQDKSMVGSSYTFEILLFQCKSLFAKSLRMHCL